jgi:hypothetical protein
MNKRALEPSSGVGASHARRGVWTGSRCALVLPYSLHKAIARSAADLYKRHKL